MSVWRGQSGSAVNETRYKWGRGRRQGTVVRVRYRISIFYANSTRVINQMETLRGIACKEELDFIGITETWLDITGKHFLPEVEIDGYTLYHRDRVGQKGGGVALYVRNTLNSFVNTNVKSVSNAEIGDRFDETDHNEIRFKINAKRKEDQNIALMPDFRKANYQGLRTHLQSVNWRGLSK